MLPLCTLNQLCVCVCSLKSPRSFAFFHLLCCQCTDKRQTHLKRGQLDVVSVLTKLPATQHSPESFNVDVNIATVM
jgi:hypothetical protein